MLRLTNDTALENADNLALCGQVRDFGFGILPDVFTPAEVKALGASINSSSALRSRAGIRHLLQNDFVAGLASCDRLSSLAKGVLGKSAVPFRATLFDKSPDANWLVVWHQDTALPLKERRDLAGWGPWSVKDGVTYAHAPAAALEQVLAIRVHLDDSDSDNGPLRVLPATHKDGVLSDDAIHQRSEENVAQECLVGAGGVIMIRPLIIHASSKTRSEMSRRVLHIEYAAGMVVAEGFELVVA